MERRTSESLCPHRFNARWDLLPKEAESQVDFLHSLELFVYSLDPNFRKSWGRSTVEAMLTGCGPLMPKAAGIIWRI